MRTRSPARGMERRSTMAGLPGILRSQMACEKSHIQAVDRACRPISWPEPLHHIALAVPCTTAVTALLADPSRATRQGTRPRTAFNGVKVFSATKFAERAPRGARYAVAGRASGPRAGGELQAAAGLRRTR